jgi:hypothetical protein
MTKFSEFFKDRLRIVEPMNANLIQKATVIFWLAITILQGSAINPFKEFQGLDDSYHWLITQSGKNMSIAKGEQFLTMGPLGFLDLADPSWHFGYSLSVIYKVFTAVLLWLSINQKFNTIYQNNNVRYLNSTAIVTFFSLVNPTSINLVIGMYLYKHKSKNLEVISWISLILVLFFVKFLPFTLAVLLYGLRSDLHKHLKKIAAGITLLLIIYISMVGIESFYSMLIGSFQIISGYNKNMSYDNLEYLDHYVYFFLFSVIIFFKIYTKINVLQKISLALIFYVIFRYGFVRHSVFHIIVTFSILCALSLQILCSQHKNRIHAIKERKTKNLLMFLIILLSIFYSIHAQKLLPFSKFNFLIQFVIAVFVVINIKQLVGISFFKYYSAIFVATFAVSGITPLNPIMPTIIKSSPLAFLERSSWSYDSFVSILTKNSEILESKYLKFDQSIELTNIASDNNFRGNFIQISYTTPINFEKNPQLKQFFPPSNPTSTWTRKLDEINAEWITNNEIDWIFFDGKNIGTRQLLNDSPLFYKYVVCNYSVYKSLESHLILEKNAKDKCSFIRNSFVNYNSTDSINYETSEFVYLISRSDIPLHHKLFSAFFKPFRNMYVNEKLVFAKDAGSGTLIRIPQELDFPGKFSLNGDTASELTFKEKTFFDIE